MSSTRRAISPFLRGYFNGNKIIQPLINYNGSGFDSGNFDAPVGSGTITFNGTNLALSGGNGTFTNYVSLPNATSLENSKILSSFQVKHVPGASTFGLGIGWRSINPTTPISAWAYLVCASGGLLGTAILEVNGVTQIGSNTIPVAQNDHFTAEITRTPYGYIVTFTNIDQGGSCNVSVDCSTTSAANSPLIGNTSKVSIAPLGGSYQVNLLSYVPVNYLTGARGILIGDSKTSYNATHSTDRTVDKLNAAGYRFYANWGAGDMTTQALACISELITLNAQEYFIDVVCNDIRNGVPDATWQANILSIHTQLENAGKKVTCIIPSCESPSDVSSARDWIITNIPNYIDMFIPTRQGNNTQPDPMYVSTDNIHLTDIGMTLKSTLISNRIRGYNRVGELITSTYENVEYTDNGLVSHVADGSIITISGTNAPIFGKYITYDQWFTGRQNLTLTIINYIADTSITSYGFGPMISSSIASSLYQSMGAIGLAEGGNKGTLYIMDTTGASPSILSQTAALAVPISSGDELILIYSRDQNVMTFTVVNKSQGNATASVSYTYNYDSPFSNIITPHAKIGFYFFGGTHAFKWHLTTNEYKSTDLVVIGDSKVMGYFVGGTANDKDIIDLWKSNNPTKFIYHDAGANEISSNWVTRLPEILQYNPKKVIIFGPTNDVRPPLAISGATTTANLTAIKNALEGIGCEVFYQNPPPEGAGGVDLSSLITIGATVFAPNKILSIPASWNITTDLSIDDIHWLASAHTKLYNNQSINISL